MLQRPGRDADDGKVSRHVPDYHCASPYYYPFAHPDFGQERAASSQEGPVHGFDINGDFLMVTGT